MNVINQKELDKIDCNAYKCKIQKCIIYIMERNETFGDIVLSVKDGEMRIEFLTKGNSTPYNLTEYGFYTSFSHKRKSWFERNILRFEEYTRLTFTVNK